MKSAVILIFVLAAVWAAPTEDDNLKQLAAANRLFAARVYKEILKTNKGNLIFSPFSAETVLALTSEGARGDTRDELLKGLSLPSSQESVQKAFKEFLPKLKEDSENLKLLSANKIYVSHDVKLEEEFRKIATGIYDSDVENVNFEQNEVAAKTINDWVESRTNSRIHDLINKDSLDSDTAMVLVNALYLAANWSSPFSEYGTKSEKFYKTATDVVQVPMMSQISYFNYYDNAELGAQFLELPYQTEGLSMVVVLPHEKEGLTALESNVEKLLAPQPWKRERVDLSLPKFSCDSQVKLVEILKALGVDKLFGDHSDLSGLSSNRKNLYVSDVIQKAFINVTETGTEAAAATAVQVNYIRAMVVPEAHPKIFRADHPFKYFIQKDGFILFAGRVTDIKFE